MRLSIFIRILLLILFSTFIIKTINVALIKDPIKNPINDIIINPINNPINNPANNHINNPIKNPINPINSNNQNGTHFFNFIFLKSIFQKIINMRKVLYNTRVK